MTASDRAAIREAAAPYPVFFQRIVMDEVRSREGGWLDVWTNHEVR